MYLSILTIFLALFFLIYQLSLRRSRHPYGPNSIKGLRSIFPFGHLSFIIGIGRPKDIPSGLYVLEMLRGMGKLFSLEDMFYVDVGPNRMVFLNSPEAAMVLLKDKVEITKSSEYEIIDEIVFQGLLTSKGDGKYKSHKKIIMSLFSESNMRDILEMNIRAAEESLRTITSTFGVNIATLTTNYVESSVLELIFGLRNMEENLIKDLDHLIKRTFHILCTRAIKPWLLLKVFFFKTTLRKESVQIKKYASNFFNKVVLIKKDMKMTNETSGPCLYDHLLSKQDTDEKSFTEEELKNQNITMYAGGFDTTRITLQWIFFLIGHNPDVQRKIQQELDNALKEKPFSEMSYDDLKNLKYLNCVIKETLRIHPVTSVIARQLKNDVTIRGQTIAKGTTVSVLIDSIHNSDRYYDKPEEFIPERFSEENSAGRHPYAFFPFSSGPRACPGTIYAYQGMTIIIGAVLHKYDIKSLQPIDKIYSMFESLNVPVKDILVDLTERKNNSVT